MPLFSRISLKPISIGLLRLRSPQTCPKMSTNVPNFEYLAVTNPKEYVVHVELNRPDKLNALNASFFEEIQHCFESLSDNENCRTIVLSGAGRVFTAGLDLKGLTETLIPEVSQIEDVARKAKIFMKYIKLYQQSVSSLDLCTKPVIVAVHNACIGAGVDYITAADIRYCTKDAYFQVKEVDIGMAADIGTLQRLPKVIGSDSLARELCYTCRKLPASEALSSGLVSNVYENKEEMLQSAVQLAEEIAKKSPVAVQTTKASLRYSRDHSVQQGLDHIAILNQGYLQSEDLVNATVGQLTKNPDIVFSKL